MGIGDILQIFFVLFVLLGVMYAMLYLVKKYLFTFDKRASKLVNISVLSTQVLMPKKYISVVKIREKVYVLGVSDNSITLLDKQEDFTKDLLDEETNPSEKKNFLDMLKQNMGRK
ncbi:MAG: flagellar biosynthetic protein FliO [Melioribacteraceae bacterium]|nr:MAG: flagellar biosynthetic protein FliO [Melioribacteraceae bacterium]